MPYADFRLQRTISALFADDGGYVARQIPKGALVKFDSSSLSAGSALINVVWESESVLMFAEDLQHDAIPLFRALRAASGGR